MSNFAEEIEKPESVKLDAATMRLVRTIAENSGRGNAEVIRRAILMYSEAYFDGAQSAIHVELRKKVV